MQAAGGQDPLATLSSELGLSAGDIERVTFVKPDSNADSGWAVLTTVKPYDKKAILGKITSPKEVKHEGKTFHVGQGTGGGGARPGPGMAPGGPPPGMMGLPSQRSVFFATPKVLVMSGDEAAMKRTLTNAARKSVVGAHADVVRQISGSSRHFLAAF